MNKKVKQFKNIFLVIFILFNLSSCNFKPAYSSIDNAVYECLQFIEIEPIESVEGADFYNHLKNILPRTKIPKYLVTPKFSYSKGFNILKDNADISRETNNIHVSYTIYDSDAQKIVASEKFTRFSSFNTSSLPYSNVVTEQTDKRNLAISAAEELRNRLILFSAKKQN